MKIHFISLNEEFIEEAKELFGMTKTPITFEIGDIQNVPRKGKAFVSPANSLGIMDGGIDLILSRNMFPGCESQVKKMIAEIGKKTTLGRPYLPVGSALWFQTTEESVLISAPTMFLPHDVSETMNAYWCMMACLQAMEKIEAETKGAIDTLVCTSLCCGVGRMDAETSALQMCQALRDFEEGKRFIEVEDFGVHYVILPSRDNLQPKNFDNREIGSTWPFI
jgi:O-acetyl-ADP-ribose deacetylase (regulator of RNase III)